jgi:uncharacterized protein YbcI
LASNGADGATLQAAWRRVLSVAGAAVTEIEGTTPGQLQAEITSLVVRLFAEYTGRGPTQARTIIRDDMIVCWTQDSMTKAEQRLVAEGEAEMVESVRRKFQRTMRSDLVGGIEMLTERKVMTMLSDHDPLTDNAVEVFILEPR